MSRLPESLTLDAEVYTRLAAVRDSVGDPIGAGIYRDLAADARAAALWLARVEAERVAAAEVAGS